MQSVLQNASQAGKKLINPLQLIVLGMAALCALAATPAGAQSGSAGSAGAEARDQQQYAIEGGPLDAVLNRFALEAGIDLSVSTELTRGKTSEGLSGTYTVDQALQRLLAESGLRYRFTGENRVTLLAAEGGPSQLQTVHVEAGGEWARGPVDGYKAQRSATATRTDTPIRDIPGSIQVVSREVIEDQNAQDLREAVRNVSGVFVDNSFGGQGFDFNIRGFNQDFKMRNGFREQGTAITRTQDLANVERVEVLKGPASITSGRLAPGGVINVVTKKPTADPMARFEMQTGTTSEGGYLFESSADLSGPVTEDGSIKYRLNALMSDRDSYREPFDQNFERTFIAPAFSFSLGPDTDMLFELEYTDDKRPFDRGIIHFDGEFSDRADNLQSRSVFAESESIAASYTLDHRFSQNLRLRHRSQVIDHERFNLENVPFDPASAYPGSFPNAQRGDFARFIGSNDSKEQTFSTQTELHANFQGLLADHELLFAVDFSRDEEDRIYQSSDSSFAFPDFKGEKNKINIFNPVHDVPAPQPSDLTYVSDDLENIIEESGVLLQDQMTVSEQWEVLLGGRFSWVEQESVDNLANTDDTREDDAVFSPRAGVVYKPLETVSLYGSYSESFEPNSARDQDDDFLEPTRGEQFELGVKADFLERRLRTTLAGFEITKTNIPRSVNTPGGGYSVPTGEQRSRGAELDVTGRITEGWTLIGSYAYIDTEITSANTNEGNKLSGVPENSASLWSNYELQTGDLQGLKVGAGAFYRGEREADNANSFQLPSFTRFDARVGYERDTWEADLTLKNVLDTEDNYEAVDFGPLVKPGTPLTVIGSVAVKF